MDLKKDIESYFVYQKELGFESINFNKEESDTFFHYTVNNHKELKPTVNMTNIELSSEWKQATNLNELFELIHECTQCPLGLTRTKFVFGEGNPNADILIIGEAPGKDEDEQGMPFVGRAGQLLTQILESVGIKREDVFIANICKCRPPNNRRPETFEVDKCEPFLHKQIELINPEFIISLGLTSIDTLLKKKHKMGDIRGEFFDYHSKKLMVTYHPAALLRNPNWKRPVWEDMKKLKLAYNEYLKNK